MSIISDMKPLILILFVATSAQAQNIATVARQERARQSQIKSTRVFSDANTHTVKPITPAAASAAAGAAAKAPVAAAKGSAAAGLAGAALNAAADAAAIDPVAEEMQKLRIRVRALEDQETSLKLQISDITNQVYAPQSDAATHNDALTRLAESQAKLADVQKELTQDRSNLQQLEIKTAARK
jgi:chromosome segregation ATPase